MSWLNLCLPNFHAVHVLTECLSIFLILGHFECRCTPLSHTVDHSHSMAWSTCERLQMFAMPVLMPLKWPQPQSRPVAVAQVSGPPSLQVTVDRKIWRNRCTWKYKHPALMKRKWCQNIAVQPVYVSEFVILLHLIWNWCLSHLSLVNTYYWNCRYTGCWIVNVQVSPGIWKHSQDPRQGHVHMYYSISSRLIWLAAKASRPHYVTF
jgi:hypothetical protein